MYHPVRSEVDCGASWSAFHDNCPLVYMHTVFINLITNTHLLNLGIRVYDMLSAWHELMMSYNNETFSSLSAQFDWADYLLCTTYLMSYVAAVSIMAEQHSPAWLRGGLCMVAA